MHEVHFEQFVTARRAPPKRTVLDFDATDIPLCGTQRGRHWHGPYRAYSYLPLYVFAGRHLLEAGAAAKRPGRNAPCGCGAGCRLWMRVRY